MEFSLEPTHESPTTSEQVPVAKPAEQSSVEKKRANKTAQCPHCNKVMSKKTLRYSHHCQRIKEPVDDTPSAEPAPPANPQPQIVKEIVKEEITDDHIKDYLIRQETQRRTMLAQQRVQRFNNLMSRAF